MDFNPVAFVESPYKQKFGIPRQPGLVPDAWAKLRFIEPYNQPEAFQGLEGYSHIWVQFIFHQSVRDKWQPTVRPPRLGGNKRVGVFASRSPFRPNPIGLSVVKLESINCHRGECWIEVSGIDLLDGTPVLDIKPYVAYVDSIPEAKSGFAPAAPEAKLTVRFLPEAEEQLIQRQDARQVRLFITQVLSLDPRPAYKSETEERIYGIQILDFDLQWQLKDGVAVVMALAPLTEMS